MTHSADLALALVLAFVMAMTGCSEAEATPATEVEDISIKTLPPDYNRPVFESADALLSDWEGEHWASLDADQDKVALSWTTNSEEAIFQIQVVTTGWVSFALTFRGSMVGSDIILGWISDSGAATLIDAHGNQFGQTVKDKSQDYRLIVGYQYQENTVLRFKRKINTCDGEDLAITNDTFHVRWAYSEQDPLKEPADLSQLPPMSRSGSRSLHLFESTHTFNQKTADALQWMVTSNSVKLPAKHTLYWCTMLKLPEMPGKHHMIGYRPNIAEANRRYVHHMMLYECHDEDANSYERFHKHVNSGYECRSPNMPDDFKRCKGVVAAWGLGGEAFSFPPEAGYPVGEDHGGATYYMFEVHYDNPGQHSGIIDSSGLEILLTPKLRQYDSGLMTVGHDVSSLHLIPPGLEHYTSVGHCPDLCTSSLPHRGVRVFSGLPHTHNLGTSVRIRHIRSGVERPVPFQDRFYDPNYQTMRRFDFDLKPNDHLMVECTYNTSSANSFIRGGFASKDEMCLVFLHYYPAANLAHCASRLSFQHVLLALGINVWPLTPNNRHLGLRIRDPWQFQNLTFSDYLKVAASKDTAVNLKLQEASLHHSHKADCYDYGRRRIYADGVEFSTPRIHNPIYEIADGCFSGNDVYDFNNNRLNQPLFSNKATPAHHGHYSSLLLPSLLGLATYHVFNVFIV